MEENKFLKNTPVIFLGQEVPSNYVLNVSEKMYISYAPELTVSTSGTVHPEATVICLRNKNKPYPTLFGLKGDWREQYLDCNLDEDKILKVYSENYQEYGDDMTTSTPEKEKVIDKAIEETSEIETMLNILKNGKI